MLGRSAAGLLLRVLVVLCAWPVLAAAEPSATQKRVGFSTLVVRIDRGDEIGLVGQDLRVQILEDLRRRGLNAVGAENLVFGSDKSDRAELMLGGTVNELECKPGKAAGQVTCRAGVEWQVQDVATEQVIYKVKTRGLVVDVAKEPAITVGRQLVFSTLNSLTTRPQFRQLLLADPAVAPKNGYAKASVRSCRVSARSMPAASDQVLDATVLVQTSAGFGSGFLLSSDGFVVTAAHVVPSAAATIRLRDGREFPGTVIRADRRLDIALIRLGLPDGVVLPCLPAKLEPMPLGADVYAIGSPASRELSFSLARGIVSGVRLLEGVQYLQTDAAVNRGNSGGPLVSANGEALAVVSFKVVGSNVEGLAFGIPLGPGLNALSVTQADGFTSPELTAAGAVPAATARTLVQDAPDAIPELEPKPTNAKDATKRKSASSGKIAIQIIGGAALAGGLLALAMNTSSDTQSLRTLGWVLTGTGGIALVVSFAAD